MVPFILNLATIRTREVSFTPRSALPQERTLKYPPNRTQGVPQSRSERCRGEKISPHGNRTTTVGTGSPQPSHCMGWVIPSASIINPAVINWLWVLGVIINEISKTTTSLGRCLKKNYYRSWHLLVRIFKFLLSFLLAQLSCIVTVARITRRQRMWRHN